jgi:glycosyltransferase involved in cell wall biosynthesis
VTGETVIICPELTSGGVGDYTRRLLENLPRIAGLRLIVPKIGSRPVSSFEQYSVEETAGNIRDLHDRLPVQGTVLVQYSAYGFDRHGYPHWLIKALLKWKRESQRTLAIMFHEIWAFWPVWNKNYLLQQLHRRDLRRLLRVTDAVFTSTSSQATHLTALSPQCPIQFLPVGSNIRRVKTANGERQAGLAVLFGLQHSRVRTLRTMLPGLKSLGGVGKIGKIVTAGAGQSREGEDEEAALLTELDLSEGFDQRGPLPEEKISELLSACEYALSAQDELSITKSSAFMAYAAHGLNIISQYADASKPEPLSLLISPDELRKGITPTELECRRERLRQWQERTAAWPSIANQIARVLGV